MLSHHLHGETEEDHANLCQNSWYSTPHSNCIRYISHSFRQFFDHLNNYQVFIEDCNMELLILLYVNKLLNRILNIQLHVFFIFYVHIILSPHYEVRQQ